MSHGIIQLPFLAPRMKLLTQAIIAEFEGKISLLEQLARRKVLSTKTSEQSRISNSPKATSLLDSLRKNTSENSGRGSLSGRLSALKESRSRMASKCPSDETSKNKFDNRMTAKKSPSLSSILERRTKSNTSQSLSSKLAALKGNRSKNDRQIPEPKVEKSVNSQPSMVPTKDSHAEPVDPRIAFEKLRSSLCHISSPKSYHHLNSDSEHSEITAIALSQPTNNDQKIKNIKRRYDEIFTVYFPNTNLPAAKKRVIENFNNPSPDDVVLDAQNKAFEAVEDVTKNVATLSVTEDSIKDGRTENEDEKPFDDEPIIRTYKKANIPTKPKNPIDLEKYLSDKKPHLNFVVLGHVDAGKSTLMGRLLYDVGAVDNKLIRKLQRESDVAGKSSFHLAWVMDQTPEERSRGVTVDVCTSDFETEASTFTIIDAPGHRDFVPNAIAGVSQADVAVLSIDCGPDAFESGFNLDGQTKEHALLARSLGVRHIIIAMNKMDTADWYEGRFRDIQWELRNFFQDIGIEEDKLSWVPCSGLSGEGVYKKEYSIGVTWYNGPSLVGSLEVVAQKLGKLNVKDVSNSPFVFSILDAAASGKNKDVTISGRVESGSIQAGETITIYPSEQSVIVESVLCGNDQHPTPIAIKGDFVGLKLRNAHYEDIQGGDLAAVVGFDIPSAQEFTVKLLTFQLDRPLLPGTPFILFRGACEQPARIKKLHSIVDKATMTKILKSKVKHLGSQKAAIVELELTEKKRRIPMLTFSLSKHLGRVVLRKEGRTIAAGLVETIEL